MVPASPWMPPVTLPNSPCSGTRFRVRRLSAERPAAASESPTDLAPCADVPVICDQVLPQDPDRNPVNLPQDPDRNPVVLLRNPPTGCPKWVVIQASRPPNVNECSSDVDHRCPSAWNWAFSRPANDPAGDSVSPAARISAPATTPASAGDSAARNAATNPPPAAVPPAAPAPADPAAPPAPAAAPPPAIAARISAAAAAPPETIAARISAPAAATPPRLIRPPDSHLTAGPTICSPTFRTPSLDSISAA